MLWVKQSRVRLSLGARIVSTLKHPERIWSPPTLLYNGYWVYILMVKQLTHDVDPSSPTSTAVKNEWNFTSTPCSMPSWSGQGQLIFSPLLLMILRDYVCWSNTRVRCTLDLCGSRWWQEVGFWSMCGNVWNFLAKWEPVSSVRVTLVHELVPYIKYEDMHAFIAAEILCVSSTCNGTICSLFFTITLRDSPYRMAKFIEFYWLFCRR